MKSNLPTVNSNHICYGDGKLARAANVLITQIIPFDSIDIDNLKLWKEDIEEYDWLYSKETDYFIKGKIKLYKEKFIDVLFVRTTNKNEWFSIGDKGYLLIINQQ